MKPIPLPGRVVAADACLAHLSLRGANEFCNRLMNLFPNISVRFQEGPLDTCWLEFAPVRNPDCILKLDCWTADSMHRAVVVADLVSKGYLVMATDYVYGW